MFAELRHNVHVSLCVLARQSACACEATPEIARALLSRQSVALRIQWFSAPTILALEADVRRALARSRFYTAEFDKITVRAGILGDRGHASVTAAALTIPGVPSALPTLRFPSSSCPTRQGCLVPCTLYRLGCVQPCACPLPQRFSVRALEQVRLVQLRDGLRATPSLDVSAGRGAADVTKVGASLRFRRRGGRGSSGWPEHPRRSLNQVVPRLAVVEVRHPSARAFGWFHWWRRTS